jgi:parallel beta-helix repeat protein
MSRQSRLSLVSGTSDLIFAGFLVYNEMVVIPGPWEHKIISNKALKENLMKVITSCISILFLSAALVAFQGAKAHGDTIECNSCSDCSAKIQSASPGDVIVLTQDITAASGIACIDFNGKGAVTFDGAGHSITNLEGVNYGIFSGYSGGSGNTFTNCEVNNFTYGLYLVYGSSNTVSNSTFYDNSIGIRLYSSGNNILENNTSQRNSIGIALDYNCDNNIIRNSYIVDNYAAGISFSPRIGTGDPESNQVYNNYLSNLGQGNVRVVKMSDEDPRELGNSFHTTLDCATGPNILGCNCIGGNYWHIPGGAGFSETCADADENGVCDLAYTYDSQGFTITDSYPLTQPPAGCCANPDKDADGYLDAACGGTDCDDNPVECGAGCRPGGVETCDGFDNDCNKRVDDRIACSDILLKKKARYPTVIGDHSCVEDSATHKIYCFGGIDKASTNEPQTDAIVRYDPSADSTATMSATLPTIRDGLGCAEDSSTHRMYCFGGYWQEFVCTDWEPWGCVGGYSIVHYLDDILEYDPGVDAVTIKSTSLPMENDWIECVEDSSTHKIYCLGGASRDEIFEYNPADDTITTKSAVLPSGRHIFSCAEDSSTNKIYCFGGRGDAGMLDEIIEYIPATDAITTKNAAFPIKIQNLSCVEDSSTHEIFCFGGYTTDRTVYNTPYIDKVFKYDPASDTLTLMNAEFSRGRHSLSCAENSADNKIYCFGGSMNVVCCDDINVYTNLSWLTGDYNQDCTVNELDLDAFADNFGRINCSQAAQCEGDYPKDNDVDGADLSELAHNFNVTSCP